MSAVRELVDLLPKHTMLAQGYVWGLWLAIGCRATPSPEAMCGLDVDRGTADPEQEQDQDQVLILEHPAWL